MSVAGQPARRAGQHGVDAPVCGYKTRLRGLAEGQSGASARRGVETPVCGYKTRLRGLADGQSGASARRGVETPVCGCKTRLRGLNAIESAKADFASLDRYFSAVLPSFGASSPLFLFVALAALLAACTGCGPKSTKAGVVPTSAPGPIRFEDTAAVNGIDFRLGHGGRSPLTILDTIGHGVALIDCDGDGLLDIVFTGPDKVRLYKNLGGFHFKDITEGSGLVQKGYWTGITTGDIDNDGKPDLFINGKGVCALYRNLGGGHFRDMTAASGLAVSDPNRWGSAALLFDYDRDGRLDLFVGAYVDLGTRDGLCPTGSLIMACGPQNFKPQKGVLYHNAGNWRFTRQDMSSVTHGKVLGVIAGDLYGDGGLELYIANDVLEADMLRYVGGRWKPEAVANGTAFNPDGRAMGGMGVSTADYDGDGRLDIVVGTFCRDPRSLFHNDGDGQFSNRAFQSGIVGVTTFYVAFGTEFADLDNDGWPDIVMVNGHVQDNVHLEDKQIDYTEPTQILRNEGDGRFADASSGAGPAITKPIVGRALCVGDLDNDGKPDLVIGDLEGPPLVLRNVSPGSAAWLRVKLVGTGCVRDGQGAVVTCVAGGRKQVKLATTGGSYFSAGDPRVHFGLGSAQKVDSLTVRWPGGKVQTVANPPLNGEIVVRQGTPGG
jgi:enediyne biosynthesis protein E4